MKASIEIIRDVYRFSGSRLVLTFVLMVATGISDGIGMALLIPLLESVGIVGSQIGGGAGVIDEAFQRAFARFDISTTFGHIAIVIIGVFFAQSLFSTVQNWLVLDIQKKYLAAWQKRLFLDFLSIEWSCFLTKKTGEMVNSFLIEAPRVSAGFFAVMQLAVAGIVLCVYLVVAFLASPQLTIYLIVASVILFSLVWPVRRAVRFRGEEFGAINSGLAAALNEMLGGAKTIRASASESRANAVMAVHIDRLCENQIWSAFLPTTYRSVFEFGAILVILGAFAYGLEVERISAAQLLLLVGLVARLLPRLMQVQVFYSLLALTTPSYALLRGTHARLESNQEKSIAQRDSGLDPKEILPAKIAAENLTVRYIDRTALDGISFCVKPGKIVGFVGPSGAGKTTLVDSILGLTMPAGGTVSVGGIPLERIDLSAWRRCIGYVAQDAFLFHDTIANNICWNLPNASMAQIERAAQLAGLESMVLSLPARYNTIIGDRGSTLSGGQRQRISLARALMQEPSLLILDEATSALDALSEQEVLGMLDSLRGKMEIIVVAHRFAAVRSADYIYVLDQGRIVEEGTWAVLVEEKTLFRRLLQAQTIGEVGT